MADALIGIVVDKLASLIENEFATFSELREKAEKLSDTLTLMRVDLEDAEDRQMTDRDNAVKVWLQQLKDAAYVLDDFLEDCSSESLQHVGLSSENPMNIVFSLGVGRRLDTMMERLNKIDQNKNRYGLREGVVRERPSGVAEWRKTTSNLASLQVYGRDEDKERVVSFLLSPERGFDGFLSVYPIVGLGGLGKTTLAQMIFNDHRVSDHFAPRIWACVSENFTAKGILCSIIESFPGEKCDVSDLDAMEQKVRRLLQNRRYLLVLDDVWKRSQKLESGVSQEKWEKVKSVLRCGSNDASILVSTRDMDVAAIMGTCQAHQLSVLSEDDCWSLFERYAFGPDRVGHAELVPIGKEIVKKCGGSPLAAKALGSLLRSKSKKEWLEVEKSKLWTLPDERDILPALRLSYSYLTPTVKQCFAFCAIFPKDEEIKKQELIHLWMANEFISPRENLEVEEVGNVIWNELHQKSFFQDVRIDDLGVIYFKMHDLVHDLAQSITKQECIYLKEINSTFLPRNTHHICFEFGGGLDNFESLRTAFQLRRILSRTTTFGAGNSRWQLPTSLRVLRAKSLDLSSLGNLIHLRYLDLSNLDIVTLPDSIYNLRRLEILKLSKCQRLHCLPEHLTRLQNLRHLVIEDCPSLSRIFPRIHRLSHLRTLSRYIAKTGAGHSLAELRDLNLGGQLTIEGLGNVGSLPEAQDANLQGKEDLRELSLSWERSDDANSNATDAQLLEALQPHQNLKALTISEYEGLHWPSWMRNNLVLNELVSLRLYHCRVRQQLPPLGELPSLKKLEIEHMDCAQYVDGDERYDGVEVRAFPSLESLVVRGLPNLERLLRMETGGAFPCLSHLKVSNCPRLQLSFLPCVKNLHVWGGNNELLRSISRLSSLDSLTLYNGEDRSLREGMMDNLTNLQTLKLSEFQRLRELPYEITRLSALESLEIENCCGLESFLEQGPEGLRSLQTLVISSCGLLRSLPDGVLQHLTSLTIWNCPALRERYNRETGDDWHMIQHIPNVTIE